MARAMSKNVRSDKVMSVAEAAYLAGFIDGEGTISIDRATRKESRTGFRYQPHFSIANTNLKGLEDVRALCGNGRLVYAFTTTRVSPLRKDGYILRFSSNQIRHVLPQIMPYLFLKKQQAEIVMEFLSLIQPGRPLSDMTWSIVEELRIKVRLLNARGGVIVVPDPPRTVRPSRTGNNQWMKTH